MSDLVSMFAELFQGRTDAYGADHGESVPVDSIGLNHPFRVDTVDHVNRSLWHQHLTGSNPIGVYPLVQEIYDTEDEPGYRHLVHWGCVDFDEGYDESWPDAVNLRMALETFGLTGWIERSRSKGYHVWVFCSEWVDALVMRKALFAACQLVGAPVKEVNPKQTVLKEGQVGNYVRLPYPGWLSHLTTAESQCIVRHADGTPILLDRWIQIALETRCTQAQLEVPAAHAVEPNQQVKGERMEVSESELPKATTDMLSGLAWKLFQEGPLDGDRSDGLFRLCRLMHESGTVTKEAAWNIVCDADRRWGKFLNKDEESGSEHLWACLERAWNK